ncbi:CHAP domain-containing protein [Georgenia sp. MJ173]|uniref:CHAP domain-containing protein n=1 Tax=Georgenia sunbinii TaxID=3117728 RepID=UPI002F266161
MPAARALAVPGVERGIAPRRHPGARSAGVRPAAGTLGQVPVDTRMLLALQRTGGNALATLVVQRLVPRDSDLHTMCFDRPVFTAMSDAELDETIAAVDRILPTLTEDADLETARGNQAEARREQAARRHPGFAAHEAAVSGAGTAGSRRAAVEALVTWSRQQLDVYPDLVRRFRRQQQPDVTEKVRVLGQAAAAVARMEFLLGTILHRGGSWEATANAGPMVDDYTGGGDAAWCTKFATSALAAIRGDSVVAGSGYKVANPTEFPGLDIETDAAQGGAFVGTRRSRSATSADSPFVELRETLTAIAAGTVAGQTAAEAAEAFLRDRIRPQPGDILVTRRGVADPNSFAGGSLSHTLMVESVSGSRISLIEGNASATTDRVSGRVLDLSVVGDVEEIVFISRASLGSGVAAAESALTGIEEVEEASRVDKAAILRPIDDLNILLEGLARSEGDVSQGRSRGTVAELVGNG